MRSATRCLSNTFESQDYFEWIWDYVVDPLGERTAADHRFNILKPLFGLLARLQKAVLVDADDNTRRAFHLGDVIDQHPCPRDVYLDLDAAPCPAGDGGAGRRVGFNGPASPPEVIPLVSRFLDPGLIPPRPGWPEDIRQAWREAGLGTGPFASGSWQANASVGLARELTARACQRLRKLARSRLPFQSFAERLRVDEVSHHVFLDGKGYLVGHAPAFKVFARLVRAGGELVEGTTLNGLPGCKGRLDRIFGHSPINCPVWCIVTAGRARVTVSDCREEGRD